MGILEFPVELNLKEHNSFSMFDELTKEITKDLEAKESRQRARRDDAKAAFEYAVKHILEQLWRNSLSLPPRESTINLGRSYYSLMSRALPGNVFILTVRANLPLASNVMLRRSRAVQN